MMDKNLFSSKAFWQVFLGVLSAILFLAAAFLSGFYYHDSQNRLPDLEILQEAYSILIHHSYKEAPDPKQLEYGMIHGLVGAYDDPYTMFQEPYQHELTTYSLEGQFGGIGVEILKNDEGFWTLYPYPDSPAEKAGVLKRDRLLAIDTLNITTDTHSDYIQAAIYGPAGESVGIKIGRPPEYSPILIDIIRGVYTIPSVSYRIDADEARLGILTINLIGSQTSDEISQAITSLMKEGVTHFILDLRQNPGGYLSAGVDIARLFLSEGEILIQQYRNQEAKQESVENPGPFTDFPLAVLIGEGTASAAEVVAGALQVNQRAILVGTNSYGKDTVQQVFVLSDESSLRVTAAHWWVPGLKETFEEQGLIPNLSAPAFEDLNQPDPGIQIIKGYFFP